MKKLNLILVFLLLVGISPLSAQSLIPDQNKKGKWGFINEAGMKVINYDYNEVSAFVEGRAKVRKGDKWGYIDVNGKEVIKIKYSEMLTWNGNYCKVAEGGSVKDGVLKGAKWGYINRNGDVVLKSEYDEIGTFKNGMAHVVKSGKYGYIDDSYRIFIPCKFSAVGAFNEQGYCWVNEGGKITGNKEITGGKYGVYNVRGEVVIKPQYKMIGTFTKPSIETNAFASRLLNDKRTLEINKKSKNDKAYLKEIEENNKYLLETVMDSLEKRIILENPGYNLMTYEFIEPVKFSTLKMTGDSYFAVTNSFVPTQNSGEITFKTVYKTGVIDKNGTEIVPVGKYPIVVMPTDGIAVVAQLKKYNLQINLYNIVTKKLVYKNWLDANIVSCFENGTAVIADASGYYMIDKTGNKVSSTYDLILPKHEDMYIVKRNGAYGIIDGSGKETISVGYNAIYPMKENLLCVQQDKDGLWGYIDKSGQYKISKQYMDARSFEFGSAVVKEASGWGVINKGGNVLIKPEWKNILPFTETAPELAWVKNTDGWRCIKVETGKYAFDGAYYGALNFNNDGVAYVMNEQNLIGGVTKTGELVIPMRLSDLERAEKCLADMKQSGKTSLSEADVYRFNLNYEPKRNEFRLTEKITENLWDY